MAGSRQSAKPASVPVEGFAARLRRQRLSDDLTQVELAERLGVPQQQLGSWERGERTPAPKHYADLTSYLSLPDDLSIGRLLSVDQGSGVLTEELDSDLRDSDVVRRLAARFLRGGLGDRELEAMTAFVSYYTQRGRER